MDTIQNNRILASFFTNLRMPELGVADVLYLAAIVLAFRFCWRMIGHYWEGKDAEAKARRGNLGKETILGIANRF